MAVLWFEELDSYIREISKTRKPAHSTVELALDNAHFSRYIRADNFDEMLSRTLAVVDRERVKEPLLQKALPELRMAKRQLSDFDYRLISLCYGKVFNDWLLAIKNDASITASPALEANLIRRELDRYLCKNELSSIGKLLVRMESLPNYEAQGFTPERTIDARIMLDNAREELWIQATLEGRII